MQTESMELGEFLESARKIRAAKDADRQFWLAKGDTQRADECHDGAKRLFKRLEDQQDPESFSFLYPYIELNVHNLRRDWLEDIESLCVAEPNWKKLTWDEIRREVLRHDKKIKSALILKEKEKKANSERMEKYGIVTSDEVAEKERERMLLRASWNGSGGDPARFESQIWGPLPGGGPLPIRPNVLTESEVDPRPNRPNVLSSSGRKPKLSEFRPKTVFERMAIAYVAWSKKLPDDDLIRTFGRPRRAYCSRKALQEFERHAKQSELGVQVNSRAAINIRKEIESSEALRTAMNELLDKAQRMARD